jgi:uncharacterized protein YndB with AHSA1/START domain
MEKNPPNEFVISRTLNAPRDKVWRAWTEREELMKWFGPKGVTIPVANMDLRPGGVFHYCMRMADGQDWWGKWTFREIEPPKKLVLISTFSDAQGGITRHPMAAEWPLQTLSTTTFEERNGKTELTIRWSPWQATEQEIKMFTASHSSMQHGWGGTFEQLEAYLAKK